MAFLKTKIAKGRFYYSLVESFRDERGKPRQKVIANLGAARNAIAYFNDRSNSLDPDDYLRFVKKVAIDSVKCCKHCGSDDVYWSPNPPHWHRYSCNDCRHMDWYGNESVFLSMDILLHEKNRMQKQLCY
jgi:hypothetical protein